MNRRRLAAFALRRRLCFGLSAIVCSVWLSASGCSMMATKAEPPVPGRTQFRKPNGDKKPYFFDSRAREIESSLGLGGGN